jgi:dihydrofolate reductase
MRRLLVSEFISLDGVVEAPGGEQTHPHAGRTMSYGVPQMFAYKLNRTLETEALLLGRITYEGFSAAWPERDGQFAEKMNAMPKDVVTSAMVSPVVVGGGLAPRTGLGPEGARICQPFGSWPKW